MGIATLGYGMFAVYGFIVFLEYPLLPYIEAGGPTANAMSASTNPYRVGNSQSSRRGFHTIRTRSKRSASLIW
ncbi:hypothetical protein SAMN04487948_11945 [Halogranum amylolyticum]|uniref:Uncharacterized protein n=1 Tax=Halogranum amylolyticum TaxID=660520 RepID=A0A1H8VSS3_9EURY|nr:hypothetical protein SAMN04487948_11945 [Halogranum amylolyticum]